VAEVRSGENSDDVGRSLAKIGVGIRANLGGERFGNHQVMLAIGSSLAELAQSRAGVVVPAALPQELELAQQAGCCLARCAPAAL
jgi:hypothetical protein